MSSVGGPIETSLLQAAQAQQSASKARDRERAGSERARRFQDLVDLRVAGVEATDAVRRLPSNDSEEAGTEHEEQATGEERPDGDPGDQPRLDVRA